MLTRKFTFTVGNKRITVRPSGVPALHTFDNVERTAIEYTVAEGNTVRNQGFWAPVDADRAYVRESIAATA